MKRFVISAVLALSANLATAAQVWSGEGKVYNMDRSLIGSYRLSVEISEVAANTETVTVRVVGENGNIIRKDTCLQTSNGTSWQKSCEGGNSKGYMLDYGLGIDYYEGADGVAYATNIVFDSETEMRLFRTELVDGKATRVFVESISKQSN